MITVISAWYNEEFLAPIFLRHYEAADKIIILLDESSDDGSENIAKCFKNVEIRRLEMPNGMDDELKIDQINAAYMDIKKGLVVSVDADEFIKDFEIMTISLSQINSIDFIPVVFYQMYQHHTEFPLNQEMPVFIQRRHGDPDIKSGLNSLYVKPCVLNSGLDVSWLPGCHSLRGPMATAARNGYTGAHWAMADKDLAIKRRIAGRRDRMSENNKKKNMTHHLFEITEEQIIAECEKHKNDPRIF